MHILGTSGMNSDAAVMFVEKFIQIGSGYTLGTKEIL